MAEELGLSPSYLNLIERNQRPITAQVLIRLSHAYSLDPREFATDDHDRTVTELDEVFADPLFRNTPVPRLELRETVESAPGLVDAVNRLYRAYAAMRGAREMRTPNLNDRDRAEDAADNPVDRVRHHIQEAKNYFPELDEAAESLGRGASGNRPRSVLCDFRTVTGEARNSRARHADRRDVGQPAPLRPSPPPVAHLRDRRSVWPHIPGSLSTGFHRDATDPRRAGKPSRARGRITSAAAANFARQLFRRGADDALRQVPRGGRSASLRRGCSQRAVRRQLRTGCTSPHDPCASRRARHSVLSHSCRIQPETCRNAFRRAAFHSRDMAAPARSGTCTRLSGRPRR